MQFKALFLAATGLLAIAAAVQPHPGAPLSGLAGNANLHDRLESIVDQLTPTGEEKGQGGNDNELLVARVPYISQLHSPPFPEVTPTTNPHLDPKYACTICILQGKKCDTACNGNKACGVYCHCKLKQDDAGCKACSWWKTKCTYTGPDHDLELEDDSALARRQPPPEIPNLSNAPAPFLACTMCTNAVTACEKTCKGNAACGIYCRCQAKATNIACMVCNAWFEDCNWEGQDHWVEVIHG